MSRVVVVGAGVVGLSCAVRLLERGHRVDVLARDLPLETTSAVAAAFWYPYRALPQDRVTAWAATTLTALQELAGDAAEGGDAGVRLVPGTEVLRRPGAEPWWAPAVPGLTRAPDLPPGYAAGWSFTSPVVEMPRYLTWLAARVADLGGTITRLALTALPTGADAVVDCAGLGARLLGADLSLSPVRGQVVLLEQVGLRRWWLDGDGEGPPTYVVPRSRDIVVGGSDEEGDWDRTPSPAVAAEILHRATGLVPELAGARVLGHRVGLRPARPTVRLERDERDERVVHCYGHGGAGVTLSWGCADEVADLLDEVGVPRDATAPNP